MELDVKGRVSNGAVLPARFLISIDQENVSSSAKDEKLSTYYVLQDQ